MAFDYSEEGSLFTLNKIRNLHPYFDVAVTYLSQFSESIRTSDADGVFEISAPIIYPRIAFLDDPYPIIHCRQRIFSGQNKIEISYGIFAILGMMGEFEKVVEGIISDRTRQESLSWDKMWKVDITGLVRCIQDALKYLKWACNAYPEEVPEVPPLTLNTDLLNDALKFIVGHELSHYTDPYYSYDFRNKQQVEVLNNCFELLVRLKNTPNKKHANQFFDLLDKADNTDEHYLQILSEEVLADFDGYHYLCMGAPVGYAGMRKLLAISLSFMAMRIVEYFESTLDSDASEDFFVPISWRAAFLQYMIYKEYGSTYEYFNEFTANEWGVYQIVDMLFRRAFLEINAGSGSSDEEEGVANSIAKNIPFCKELIKRMSSATIFAAEDVFREIDSIYRRNVSDLGFQGAFQTKEMAEILCRLGCAFYEAKQYKEAYKWFYRGSTYFERSKELPGLSEADCYEQMGNLCYDMGDYGYAVGWYNESIFIRQEVLKISLRDNLEIYLRIAHTMIMNGQEDSAEKLLKDILERTDDDGVKAEVYRNLGIIYDDRMDYSEALKWFKMSVDIVKKYREEESLAVASLYNSIGTVLSCMKEYDSAEDYLRQALLIKQRHTDIDPISVTNSMFNLGMLELRRKCYPQSLKWFEKVLNMRMICLGDDHPLTADALHSIGTAYFFQGRYSEARSYGQQAMSIFQKKLGRSHQKTQRSELLLMKIDESWHPNA